MPLTNTDILSPPDVQGAIARAWRVVLSPDAPPATTATLAAWVISGPFHPAWHYWVLSVIHLRDLAGVPPAKKHYPEADYEFVIASLDDLGGHDPHNPTLWRMLSPLDVCEQFHGMTDTQAVEMLTAFIRAICDGVASPDSDYRRFWKAQIQAAMAHATGEHTRRPDRPGGFEEKLYGSKWDAC